MVAYIILFGLVILGGMYFFGWAFAQRLIEEDQNDERKKAKKKTITIDGEKKEESKDKRGNLKNSDDYIEHIIVDPCDLPLENTH